MLIRILSVVIHDVCTVGGEYGHIYERCPVVVGHLKGDRVEIVGADDAVASVDEKDPEKGD